MKELVKRYLVKRGEQYYLGFGFGFDTMEDASVSAHKFTTKFEAKEFIIERCDTFPYNQTWQIIPVYVCVEVK